MRHRTARPDALMGTAELADYVGVPIATVYCWNSHGTGPRRIRVGKHIRYRLADVDRWLDQRAEGGPAA